jgi:hypothetical protein
VERNDGTGKQLVADNGIGEVTVTKDRSKAVAFTRRQRKITGKYLTS